MKDTVFSVLQHSFLFRNMSENDFEHATDTLKISTELYSKGEVVCSPESFVRRIGFIISGACEVLNKHETGSDVRLRPLGIGDTFGILSVFSDGEDFPTTIVATKATEILYITKDEIYSLVEGSPKVALNVIEFFAGRINFLNTKVVTFSSISVEQKVARYIIEKSQKQSASVIALNKAKASTELGIGRASLYRTLSQFSDEGLIKIDNKSIQIIDLNGLERITK